MSAVGSVLGGIGDVVRTGAKPFVWLYNQDQNIGRAGAAEYLAGQARNWQAMGVTDPKALEVMRLVEEGKRGEAFKVATAGDPVGAFTAESFFAPSTWLSLGATAAPASAGSKAVLTGAKAAPEVAPWVRAGITARSLPQAFRGASNAQRLGMVAQGADRAFGLPFDVAMTIPRMARTGSLARRVPAIDYMFRQGGDSLSKIAARNIANAMNMAERSAVPIRRALGLDEQALLPTMGGIDNPTGVSAGANLLTPQPRAVQNDLYGAPRRSGPDRPFIGPEQPQAPQPTPASTAQRALSNEDMARLEELEKRLWTSQSEEETEAIIAEVVAIESGRSAAPEPVGDVRLQRAEQLDDQAVAAESAEDATRFGDEAERLRTEASDGPPVVEAPVAGDDRMALYELHTAYGAELEYARRGTTGRKGGNMSRIARRFQRSGEPMTSLPVTLVRLFGGVLPEETGYRGTASIGYGQISNIKKELASAKKAGMGADVVGRIERRLSDAEERFAYEVLAEQTDERLLDLMEYADSLAWSRGRIPADARGAAGYRLLDPPEHIKERLQYENGVKQHTPLPEAPEPDVIAPEPSSTVSEPSSTVSEPSSTGNEPLIGPQQPEPLIGPQQPEPLIGPQQPEPLIGPTRPEPEPEPTTNPFDSVFEETAGPRADSEFPDIDMSDEHIRQLRAYKKQIGRALDEHDNDVAIIKHIWDQAQATNPALAKMDASTMTMAEMRDALRGAIPDEPFERVERIFDRYEDIGIDLLQANQHQAVGTMAMIEVAREIDPAKFRDRGAVHRWLLGVLPSMWKEQALLTPRFGLSNALDIAFRSLMEGYMPFGGHPTVSREGTSLTRAVPQTVKRFADSVGLPVPAELTDSFREAIAGTGKAFLTGAREDSSFRRLFNWSQFNPIAWVSEANLAMNGAVEISARTGIWQQFMERELLQQGPEQLEIMLRRADIPEEAANQLRRLFQSRGYRVDAQVAGDFMRQHGVRERVVRDFQKHWRNTVENISADGIKLSNKIHFDYANRTNLDRWVGRIIPFHFWASRNIPYYMQHLAENPWLAAAWLRYDRIAKEEAERRQLPDRFSSFLQLGGSGIIGAIFGIPGILATNPAVAMSITSQIDPRPSYDREDDSALGELVTNFRDKTGIGPGPHADWLLNVTGQYGDAPFDPNVVRMGPLLNYMGIPTGDRTLTRATNEIRGALTGQDTSSLTGSQFMDRKIRQRISELAIEEGRGPNDPIYLQAINDPDSDIWKKAREQVERVDAVNNTLSALFPLPMKYATDTSVDINAARNQVGEQRDALRGIAGDNADAVSGQIEQMLESANPDAYGLSQAYSGVGSLGASPQLVEIRRQMELFSSFGKQADAMPKGIRGKLYEDFFKKYPLVQEYLEWREKHRNLGTNIEPGTTFERFIAERNRQ